MLKELVKSGGVSSREDIAKALLLYDPSQVEYYEQIVDNMVGRVLRGRSVVDRDRKTKDYRLELSGELTSHEQEELIELCEQKLEEFLGNRKSDLYSHRRLATGKFSGTLRYEVLKRAKFRCELCGTSAVEKALHVDHIVPRSKGGPDEINNFQALCYSCNSNKGNKDDTDFRSWGEFYGKRQADCLFCETPKDRIVSENELAYAIRDAFPVTEGHTLVIPKRHVADYFDLEQPELNAINQLITNQKLTLESDDSTIEGFNIGINCGEVAGQTIFHCHVHLIPRRKGDVEQPKGGVRGVIAGKAAY
ncbi:HIT domain-containing protein [Gammaproteobacteria bacterium LSUCC0057]|uniref:HIT domain-containing protein n=1 Tax=Gammaproteobacteria bacterium LSUCC0057 TaxID=2559237 RepID=A0A4Y8UGR5_9GAMM|nr:HIT domain-containing protein [Gammaproteobacteria bacterium LSUCC0057]